MPTPPPLPPPNASIGNDTHSTLMASTTPPSTTTRLPSLTGANTRLDPRRHIGDAPCRRATAADAASDCRASCHHASTTCQPHPASRSGQGGAARGRCGRGAVNQRWGGGGCATPPPAHFGVAPSTPRLRLRAEGGRNHCIVLRRKGEQCGRGWSGACVEQSAGRRTTNATSPKRSCAETAGNTRARTQQQRGKRTQSAIDVGATRTSPTHRAR